MSDADRSGDLNARIREVEGVPYFGWFWRDVDWADREHGVELAVAPLRPPSWWHTTAEAWLLGKPYTVGGEVRFCQNNKWGYEEFHVAGEAFVELRRRVTEYVDAPTSEARAALAAYMNGLCPKGLADKRI